MNENKKPLSIDLSDKQNRARVMLGVYVIILIVVIIIIRTMSSPVTNELANNNTTTNQLNTNTSNKKIINKELTKEQILFNVIKKEIGIMNLGNTCFINACLQILIHCPIFIYKLIKNKNLINENTPITSNFLSICNIMANTEESTIDISDFKNILGLKHEIYESYMKNDSQEF